MQEIAKDTGFVVFHACQSRHGCDCPVSYLKTGFLVTWFISVKSVDSSDIKLIHHGFSCRGYSSRIYKHFPYNPSSHTFTVSVSVISQGSLAITAEIQLSRLQQVMRSMETNM